MNADGNSHRAILLVEDNPDDVELTRLAFAEVRICNPLVVARDGVEALDYLFSRGAHAGREPRDLPALVLLDLNLPKLDGREVIQAIRADPATLTLPVVALTTSAEPDEVEGLYALGINSYIQKPVDFTSFVAAMRQLGLYWLVLNQGPPG
jgi:CheY-like chemotaxis protein